MVSLFLLLILSLFTFAVSFTSPIASSCTNNNKLPALLLVLATSNNHHNNNHDNDNVNSNQSSRRDILHKSSLTFGSLITLSTTPTTQSAAFAMGGGKSRTAGYKVQHTEKEWSDLLSPTQYFILRNGGTEAPYSSILEGEDRNGLFVCAGCNTPLFNSNEKFHSGTGWPSFAKPIIMNNEESSGMSISNVEMENVSKIQYQLAGAEVRCQSCGGHLGDVFADGYLFPGTPAFVTGKRYCIDGAALLFIPKDQGSSNESGLEVVRGDMPPKNGGKGAVFPG